MKGREMECRKKRSKEHIMLIDQQRTNRKGKLSQSSDSFDQSKDKKELWQGGVEKLGMMQASEE